VLTDLCTRKKLAPNLVASGQDLKAVVRATAGGQPLPDSPLTRGWRAGAILSELMAILNGSHAIRVSRPAEQAPLSYLMLEREVDPAPAAGPDRPPEPDDPIPHPPENGTEPPDTV
jgi:ribonuclease D